MLWRSFDQKSFCRLCVKVFKIVSLILAAGAVFFIGCPIKKLTGLRCPTCGMTRAMLSLLKGRLEEYCFYNKMALPVSVAILLEFYAAHFGGKRILHMISVSILVLNFVFYLCNMFGIF